MHKIIVTKIPNKLWNLYEIECTTQWSINLERDMEANGLLICYSKSSFDTDIVIYIIRFIGEV